MWSVFEVTFPVFALVFCGYAGAARRMLPERAVDGINAFVYWFALPALLFRVIGLRPVTELFEPRVALAYLTGTLTVFGLTILASRSAWLTGTRTTASQAVAFGLTAAHGNVGYLGLALGAELGKDTLPTVALVIICDIFVLITVALGLLEWRRGAGGERHVAGTIVGGLIRSPLVSSIGIGLAFALSGLELPTMIDNFSRMLGNAAGPCALFAIGASLGTQPLAVDRTVVGLTAIKLLLHPLLAALILFGLFRVEPRIAAVCTVCAALPGASNNFIIAQRYGQEVRDISASILVGTFVALLTVSGVIWALGLVAMPG